MFVNQNYILTFSDLELYSHVALTNSYSYFENSTEQTLDFPLSISELCSKRQDEVDPSVSQYFDNLLTGQCLTLGKTAENFISFGITVNSESGELDKWNSVLFEWVTRYLKYRHPTTTRSKVYISVPELISISPCIPHFLSHRFLGS